MKLNDQELEQLLRKSPKPEPPAGLLTNLIQGIHLDAAPEEDNRQSSTHGGLMNQNESIRPSRWLNSWWPMAVAAGLTLACLALVAYQQIEIRKLQESVTALRTQQATPTKATPEPASNPPALSDRQDLERLRRAVDELREAGNRKVALQQENSQMRKVLDDAALDARATEQPAEGAFEKSKRIQCINNLKQLGLAARVWSTDNGDVYPPSFLSMSNELSNTKVLVCPSETGRTAATDWASFTMANCSYEYLSPNAPETEPQRVLFRCRLHNAVTLCDGSVQSLQSGPNSTQVVVRNGVPYLESPSPLAVMSEAMRKRYGLPAEGTTPGNQPATDPRLMERYGLLPANTNPAPEPVTEGK